MHRRKFVSLVGLAALQSNRVLAQTRRKPAKIGWLTTVPISPWPGPLLGPFLQGMAQLEYVEGRDFEIVHRDYGNNVERAAQAAGELVELRPDVIIAAATVHAVALKNATNIIPIVAPVLSDAVELKLINSEARPGGNLTGIEPYLQGLPAKQLEMAREVVPDANKIGLLHDRLDPKSHPQRAEIIQAAKSLGVNVLAVDVDAPEQVGRAYETFAAGNVQVVIVTQSSMLWVARKLVTQVAASHSLPTVYGYREFVEVGGLVSYGINLRWCYRRAAYYVDRILKGALPSELPVEFPTTIELVINLGTSKKLGLDISKNLLARADELVD